MTHRAKWAMRGLLVAVASVGLGCLLATHGEAASPSPRVVAYSPSGHWLQQLDARTLRPVRGGWSRAVKKYAPATALSPSGSRVAIEGRGDSVLVLDSASGRIVRKYHDVAADGLYWLGHDDPELLVVYVESCDGRCGPEYTILGTYDPPFTIGFWGYAESEAPLREGLVFGRDPFSLTAYGVGHGGEWADYEIALPRMPREAPFSVISDVAHDRVFAISSGGLVAQVDRVFDAISPYEVGSPRVLYHPVELNGRAFTAAWAGAGKIALWGEDGLGTIDTRTWTTHTIAPRVTGAVATPSGIAAWTSDPADGLSVYRPDGRRLYRVLVGKQIRSGQAVGGYLYAKTKDGSRFSVDLRTGEVVGPLHRTGSIIEPTLVSIP